MDLSPAQPNTPAVSADSMTGWMEYLHMQKPKPTNTTGVTVTLTATDQNGNKFNIGTATSDASGLYSVMWTPPTESKYTITASFEGSESYYASSAETVVGVTAASSSSVSPSTISSPSAASPGLLCLHQIQPLFRHLQWRVRLLHPQGPPQPPCTLPSPQSLSSLQLSQPLWCSKNGESKQSPLFFFRNEIGAEWVGVKL
jgi:hypothetical protein